LEGTSERPMEDLEILLAFLRDKNTYTDGFESQPLELPWDLRAEDFLDFANADLGLQEGDRRSVVNALSNAKRALHCQLDSIIIACGLHCHRATATANFSKKLATVSKLGVIAPRVLSKVNQSRNLMEHEYVSPSYESVCDFVDVVALFVAGTTQVTHWPVFAWGPYNRSGYDNVSVGAELDSSVGRLKIRYRIDRRKGTLTLYAGEEAYLQVLAALLPLPLKLY